MAENEAITRHTSEDPPDHRPFSHWHEAGLLWSLNRYFLHPLGLALAFVYDEGGAPVEGRDAALVPGGAEPLGWSIEKADDGVWTFEEGLDKVGRERFFGFLREVAPEVMPRFLMFDEAFRDANQETQE